MITREQIEKLRKAHVVVGRNGARFVAVSEADYEALCALALERLDMEPRPLSEIDDGGALILALNEMDEPSYHFVFKYPNGQWLSHGMGKPWPLTQLAIPLTALEKP